jgi:hypothetical protein
MPNGKWEKPKPIIKSKQLINIKMKKLALILFVGASLSSFAQNSMRLPLPGGDVPVPPVPNLSLEGPSSICDLGSKKYTYKLTGFPAGAKNIIVNGWNYGAATTVVMKSAYEIEVEFGCSTNATTTIKALSGSYNIDTTLCFFANISKVVTINILDTKITKLGVWNSAPKYYDQTDQIYSIDDVCGATDYQWNIPVGWTAKTALKGVASIKVTPTLNTGGVISVDAYNNCGKKMSYSQTITRYKEPPVFNTVEHSQCVSNDPSKTFNINPVANANHYYWNQLPSGWSYSGGSSPTQLYASVNFNNVALKSNVCVQTVYPDGVTSTPTCFAFTTYNSVPALTYWTYEESPGSVIFNYYASGNDKLEISDTRWNAPTNWFDFNFNPYSVRVIAPRKREFLIRTKNDCGVSETIYAEVSVQPNPSPVPLRLESELSESNAAEIMLFPNPSNGLMQLNYALQEAQEGEFIIIDLLGEQVANYKLKEGVNTLPINITEVQNGIYLYRVLVKGKVIKTDKLSIVH